jgi:DtxR family Mn-dependent transcriptional regulator
LPQEVEDRLYAALDRPATCPHGFPIPGTGTDDLPEMPPLYDLAPGDRAIVALPGSTDPEVAIFLDGLGVRPGVEVEIREKHPFDGPMVVSVDGQDRTLGERVARQILVRLNANANANANAGANAGAEAESPGAQNPTGPNGKARAKKASSTNSSTVRKETV